MNKVKGFSENNKHQSLPRIIGADLIRFRKLPLFLFICIIVTAIMVVTTTYRTRLLTAQREQLILEYNALDIEWRNLILEKNVLSKRDRIEQIAMKKLHLQYIDFAQENIVLTNKDKYDACK